MRYSPNKNIILFIRESLFVYYVNLNLYIFGLKININKIKTRKNMENISIGNEPSSSHMVR